MTEGHLNRRVEEEEKARQKDDLAAKADMTGQVADMASQIRCAQRGRKSGGGDWGRGASGEWWARGEGGEGGVPLCHLGRRAGKAAGRVRGMGAGRRWRAGVSRLRWEGRLGPGMSLSERLGLCQSYSHRIHRRDKGNYLRFASRAETWPVVPSSNAITHSNPPTLSRPFQPRPLVRPAAPCSELKRQLTELSEGKEQRARERKAELQKQADTARSVDELEDLSRW